MTVTSSRSVGRVIFRKFHQFESKRWEHSSAAIGGWSEVTEATDEDSNCRRKVIEKLYHVARQHKDHPPIEAINELLRQCSRHGEIQNAHKLSEMLSFSGVAPNPDTFVQLTSNFSYFPKPGTEGPG
uniref:Uncharacterized protein n=1 Tax=Tetraselmis chuii TaxID=63592 RepID=A0A7S1SSZ3_9CHLO|mmetsp:Transcript_26701/g.47525  ORF Transcript_26701/g.47525 Transcript_26701/m.47525 type:complete len:127 (+) Transcript_26701:131-511(+)